ncbi:MAG: class I SAM-dependent methyltransferase [Anaerolineae bacterium]
MSSGWSAGQPGDQGDAPDGLLEEFIDVIPIGRALDLGMGEGQNAVWLAEHGFRVVGIDLSPVAVGAAQRLAHEHGVVLETAVADIREFKIEPDCYTLVLASAVLHFLRPEEIRELAGRIKAGLRPGGFVVAHVFTVDDPGYAALQDQGASVVAERTFVVPEIEVILHYFAFGELRSLFKGLEIVYYAEERHLDSSGDDAHYHAGAFLVARRSGQRGRGEPTREQRQVSNESILNRACLHSATSRLRWG